MYANELELLEGAPEDFSIPRASGKDIDQYQSSEDEPTLLPSSDSTEKGFGKIAIEEGVGICGIQQVNILPTAN